MKQFGILAALDSSHPKFGQALTVAEGTGEDALVLLDRGRRETENWMRVGRRCVSVLPRHEQKARLTVP